MGAHPFWRRRSRWRSTLDELIFVLGPALVTALALLPPSSGCSVHFSLLSSVLLALALQRRTEPAPAGVRDQSERSAISTPGLRVLVGTFVAAGAIFGTLDVQQWSRSPARSALPPRPVPLLALVAAGSSALAYGTRQRWRLPLRFVASVVVLWVGTFPLALAPSVALMTPASILAGVAIAPTLIAGFTLVQKLVPSEALTEGLNWTITALGGGSGWGMDGGAHRR